MELVRRMKTLTIDKRAVARDALRAVWLELAVAVDDAFIASQSEGRESLVYKRWFETFGEECAAVQRIADCSTMTVADYRLARETATKLLTILRAGRRVADIAATLDDE